MVIRRISCELGIDSLPAPAALWSCHKGRFPMAASETDFGYRRVPLADKQGLVDDVFHSVAPPLRPDERPDVGRPAPALEGRAGRAARSAEGQGRSRCSTWPAAPATSPSASPSMARRRHAEVTVADINADMLAVGRERAGEGAACGHRVRRGQCRGAALRRQELRRLHHRLRHPQRAAHRRGAGRGPSRAEARRPLPLPGILRGRRAGPRPALRPLFVRRHPGDRPSGRPATPRPTAIWSNCIRKFPAAREASPT